MNHLALLLKLKCHINVFKSAFVCLLFKMIPSCEPDCQQWDNLAPLYINNELNYFHKPYLSDMSDCFKPEINSLLICLSVMTGT